ncbi:MAG: hypothetical protein KIS87_06155 [Phycisphaeraceae bacterium]|nr:hypothetical protein [Phycisphaeraceae bacterium]
MPADSLDLLRRWSVRHDPDDAGLRERSWEVPPREGWVSTRTDEPWQIALGEAAAGIAWYRRRARLPARWLAEGRRVRLRFEAVATDCRVWVNGVEVGSHSGDYLPFQFDITDALAGSERAEIVCRVDQVVGRRPEKVGEEPWIGHITKGFHDVISLQHAGIWGGVSVRQTGLPAIRPDGLAVFADPVSGEVRLRVELEPGHEGGRVVFRVRAPGTGEAVESEARFEAGAATAEAGVRVGTVARWSPDEPRLGEAVAIVRGRAPGPPDVDRVRFAFRTVETGGPGNSRILLNGAPLLMRGVLDWGHEPKRVAPTTRPGEVRERFARLREMGFNAVCMCMWYAPRWFYDIADETGMLLWQIHPVWKSDMDERLLPEYRRLYGAFMRRDRRHPSVVIVSATCEHERFHPDLAAWWWETARAELPGRLLQVQTGFLNWSNGSRTDLHDEHTYDNPGRWGAYFDDLRAALGRMQPRPFVMGETIIGTSWPDTAGLLAEVGASRPWWLPKQLDRFAEFERRTSERFSIDAARVLRRGGDRFNLLLRKWQSEVFREEPSHAGWVMNHLRDVPVCQCGFEDDLGRWRFAPEQTWPWLADAAILLRTPDRLTGVTSGSTLRLEAGISNFSDRDLDSGVRIITRFEHCDERAISTARLRAGRGEVVFASIDVPAPAVDRPTRLSIRAEAEGAEPNRWELWVMPERGPLPQGTARLEGLPFTDAERETAFEERAYSSGWALPCRSWRPSLPDTAALLPDAEPVAPDRVAAGGWRALVTHRLTPEVVHAVEAGGRVLLLASKAAGSPPAEPVNLYGQIPLVIDSLPGGPLAPGEGDWVADCLLHDLNRRVCRAVPTARLGLDESVEPVVRLVFTHDRGGPEAFDQVFAVRVGEGVLLVSALDHADPAGRYLLHRMIAWLAADNAPASVRGTLDTDSVSAWVVTPNEARP